MAETTIAQLETALKTVTDRVDKLDPLIQGKEHLYFRCLHSHKLFPFDYVAEWGRKYGIGIGGDVRSECFDTEYNIMPSLEKIKKVEQIMHPMKVSGAPIDAVFLSRPAPKSMLLIPAHLDPDAEERGLLVRAKQLQNPNNRIQVLLIKAREEGLIR